MTGPNYPLAPRAGSNAIGSFVIGVSAIGSIRPFDVWKTIASQYANSPTLTRLIENCADYVDQTENFDSFFDMIWNVETAEGHGLDVWGRIVGVRREIQVVDAAFFGFAEASPGSDGFGPDGSGSFYDGASLTSTFILTDASYRRLILAKAFANICDGSIPSINRLLLSLFPGRGNCYVTDGEPSSAFPFFGFRESTNAQTFGQATFYAGSPSFPRMRMTYTFLFLLTPLELAIVQTSGVLPTPTGVSASVVQLF